MWAQQGRNPHSDCGVRRCSGGSGGGGEIGIPGRCPREQIWIDSGAPFRWPQFWGFLLVLTEKRFLVVEGAKACDSCSAGKGAGMA